MLKDLIERCISKDRAAWMEFVGRFQGVATTAIKMRLRRSGYSFQLEDVKDIVQNVFLDIWERNKLEQLRDRERIEGWLAIVSQNAAIDYIRRNSSKGRILISAFESQEGEVLDPLDSIAGPSLNPAEATAAQQLSEDLADLMKSLSPKERLAVTLNVLYEKTHHQVAQILRIPVNTASSLIRRTKNKLKKELEKRGYKNF